MSLSSALPLSAVVYEISLLFTDEEERVRGRCVEGDTAESVFTYQENMKEQLNALRTSSLRERSLIVAAC